MSVIFGAPCRVYSVWADVEAWYERETCLLHATVTLHGQTALWCCR